MTTTHERNETFEVFDDYLIHKVVPRRGDPYEHRCSKQTFEQVAHAIDESGDGTFTGHELARREDLPFTQVAVALAFLKERGIVQTRYRRNYAGSSCVFEDAMVEFLAMDPTLKTG
jgi:hypothetical protein